MAGPERAARAARAHGLARAAGSTFLRAFLRALLRRTARSRRAAPAAPQPTWAAAVRDGAARARIREAPGDAAVIGAAEPLAPAARPRQHRHDPAAAPDLARAAGVGMPDRSAEALAQAAARVPQQADRDGQPVWRAARAALRL